MTDDDSDGSRRGVFECSLLRSVAHSRPLCVRIVLALQLVFVCGVASAFFYSCEKQKFFVRNKEEEKKTFCCSKMV